MSKTRTGVIAKTMSIENNPRTSLMDFQFSEGTNKASFSMRPLAAIEVLNLQLRHLILRQEEEVTTEIQTFAIKEIEAKSMSDGQPYLMYQLENGLGFGSGLERDKLETLYHQLGDAAVH